MHYGTVDYAYDDEDILEASIMLTLMGNNGTTDNVVFVVDTGLTEEMALTNEIIHRLGLSTDDDAGELELTLAAW